MTKDTWESAYFSRTDLTQFGDNALGLFGLGLSLGVEDLVSIAADAITDGADDKKCDIIYVDPEENVAVIAQCYFAHSEKPAAPANKASDLHTAASWLLQSPLQNLPDRIRSAAEQLRAALKNGSISDLHFWYIHNLPESKNVESEMGAVERAAQTAIASLYPGQEVKVIAQEVGRETLEMWYSDSLSPILVNDNFKVIVPNGYEFAFGDWQAYVTTFPLSFIRRVYRKYRTKLFSANVRDYLGSRRSDQNINYGIKKTVESEPENFWVFNNGITILIHDFEVIEVRGRTQLSITGLSIVNGAQTTGAVSAMTKKLSPEAFVPVRLIKTSNQEVIYDIIRYNNSQNKVTAPDFRSTDRVQKRLRDEFTQISGAEYEGGRRGGAQDKIRRRPNLFPSNTVGQAIAAVHGDPIVAYNQKSDIWISDNLYARFFNDQTSAKHITFCFSLLRAIEQEKLTLVKKARDKPDTLTEAEQSQLSFFRNRGSIFLLTTGLSACLETFLKVRIHNRFKLHFNDHVSPRSAQNVWAPLISTNISFCTHQVEAFSDGLRSADRVKKAVHTFQGLVQATSTANAGIYREFARHVDQAEL